MALPTAPTTLLGPCPPAHRPFHQLDRRYGRVAVQCRAGWQEGGHTSDWRQRAAAAAAAALLTVQGLALPAPSLAAASPVPSVAADLQKQQAPPAQQTPDALALQPLPSTFPPLPPLALPKYKQITLTNGLRVFLLEDHELPVVRGEGRTVRCWLWQRVVLCRRCAACCTAAHHIVAANPGSVAIACCKQMRSAASRQGSCPPAGWSSHMPCLAPLPAGSILMRGGQRASPDEKVGWAVAEMVWGSQRRQCSLQEHFIHMATARRLSEADQPAGAAPWLLPLDTSPPLTTYCNHVSLPARPMPRSAWPRCRRPCSGRAARCSTPASS